MELIGERQSLWLHHARCNCTETLWRNRGISFSLLSSLTYPRRGTIKTNEATFVPKFRSFFFFSFYSFSIVTDRLSRFLNIVLFFFFSFFSCRTSVLTNVTNRGPGPVFKGIKVGGRGTVEEPPVEISMNRIAVSACLLSTSRVAFHLNGDKIGLRYRHMQNERASPLSPTTPSRVAFEYLKKKVLSPSSR